MAVLRNGLDTNPLLSKTYTRFVYFYEKFRLGRIDGDLEDLEEQDVELDPGAIALLERASRALDHPAMDADVAET